MASKEDPIDALQVVRMSMAETYLMAIHLVDHLLHLETSVGEMTTIILTDLEILAETPTIAVTKNVADLLMAEIMYGTEREALAQDELRNTRNLTCLKYPKCLKCLKHLSGTHRPYQT